MVRSTLVYRYTKYINNLYYSTSSGSNHGKAVIILPSDTVMHVRHVKPFDPKLRGRKVLKVVTWLPTVDKHSFVGFYFSAKRMLYRGIIVTLSSITRVRLHLHHGTHWNR